MIFCSSTSWPPWGPGGRSSTKPAGRHHVADEVRARCATLGREVLVVLPAEEFTGRAVEIDDAGRLLVETRGVRRPVTAADIVHLRTV